MSFQCYPRRVEENQRRRSTRHCDIAFLADTSVVSQDDSHADQQTDPLTTDAQVADTPSRSDKNTPLAGKLQMMACLCSGKDWECQAYRRDLSASFYPVGDKAQKSNITHITKKWLDFTSRRDINPIDTTIARVLDFLSELVESDLSYSAINTARAALSACVTVENGMTLSEHILVKKFMKGVYELRPALPKHNQIWDPETFLQFLMKSSPLSVLSLNN